MPRTAATPPKRAILAVFRPASREIALFVDDGGQQASTLLELDEARALHATLGGALALARVVDTPLAAMSGLEGGGMAQAVGGDRLLAVRAAVAGVVRPALPSGIGCPLTRFAARIEQGGADDSEPMRIGLAVAARIEQDYFS